MKHVGLCLQAGTSPAYSKLYIVSHDSSNWVLSKETAQIVKDARSLGINARSAVSSRGIIRQSIFFASQFVLYHDTALSRSTRNGVALFHGLPNSENPALRGLLPTLAKKKDRFSRVIVSHKLMHDLVLDFGIDPAKVFRIPIAIDSSRFRVSNKLSRWEIRKAYGIPQTSAVVGSFQKDGEGWGEGNEPKLIKGPDVFLETLACLRDRVKDLHVLLTGPARGYVKRGLIRLDIPFTHVNAVDYQEVIDLYHSLDVYIVSSRDEGGPKAVLEAMASGVPLVTTRVGQAADLVIHGENGWLAEIDDSEALCHWAAYAIENRWNIDQILLAARKTAEHNSYDKLLTSWQRCWEGFVRSYQEVNRL